MKFSDIIQIIETSQPSDWVDVHGLDGIHKVYKENINIRFIVPTSVIKPQINYYVHEKFISFNGLRDSFWAFLNVNREPLMVFDMVMFSSAEKIGQNLVIPNQCTISDISTDKLEATKESKHVARLFNTHIGWIHVMDQYFAHPDQFHATQK
jgi:hypothetical protein